MTSYAGIYRGVVTNAVDPEQLGRIKAQVPQVLGQSETGWAWPVTPNIANIPALHIGDPVWVAFEGGELEHPLWLGTWPLVGLALDVLPAASVDLPEIVFPDPPPPPPPPDETLFWMGVSV